MGNKESQAQFDVAFAAEFPEFGADGVRIEYEPGFLIDARARREKEWRAQQQQEAAEKKKKKKKKKKGDADEGDESDELAPVPDTPDKDEDMDDTGDSDAYEDADEWTDTDGLSSSTNSDNEHDALKATSAAGLFEGDRSALYDEAYCYTAIFPYAAENDTELNLGAGAIVTVVETAGDWWRGLCDGATGWFPALFVTPTPHRFVPPSDFAEYCAHQALAAFQHYPVEHDPTYAELQYGADEVGYTNLGPHELAYASAPVHRLGGGGEPVYDQQHAHLHAGAAVDSYAGLEASYAQPLDVLKFATPVAADSYGDLQAESSTDATGADAALVQQWRQYEADKAAFEEEERRAYVEWEAQMRAYEQQQESFLKADEAAQSLAQDHLFRQRGDDYEELPAVPTSAGDSEAPYATILNVSATPANVSFGASSMGESNYSEISELIEHRRVLKTARDLSTNVAPPLPPPRHEAFGDSGGGTEQQPSIYLVPVKISAPTAPKDAAPPLRAPGFAGPAVAPYHVGSLPATDDRVASASPVVAARRGVGPLSGLGPALASELASKAATSAAKPRAIDIARAVPTLVETVAFAPIVALKKVPVVVLPPKTTAVTPQGSTALARDDDLSSSASIMPLPPSAVRKNLQQQQQQQQQQHHSQVLCEPSEPPTVKKAVLPPPPTATPQSSSKSRPSELDSAPTTAVAAKRATQPLRMSSPEATTAPPLPVQPLTQAPPLTPHAELVPLPKIRAAPPPPVVVAANQEPPVRVKPLRSAPVAPNGPLVNVVVDNNGDNAAPRAANWPPPPPLKSKVAPVATAREALLPSGSVVTETTAVVLPVRRAPPPPAGVQPLRKAPPPPAGVKGARVDTTEGGKGQKKRRRRRVEGPSGKSAVDDVSNSRPPPPSRSVPQPPSRPVPQPPSVLAALEIEASLSLAVVAEPPAPGKYLPPPPPPAGGKGLPKPVAAVMTPPDAASVVGGGAVVVAGAGKPAPAPKPRARLTDGGVSPSSSSAAVPASLTVPSPRSTAAVEPPAAVFALKPVPKPRGAPAVPQPLAQSPVVPAPAPDTVVSTVVGASSVRPPRPATAAVTSVTAAPKPPIPTAKAASSSGATALTSSAAKATMAAVQIRRALVAHTATKPGELTFKAGDVLVQMTEADAKGLCRGMLQNGVVGCYPAAKVVKFG